MSENILLFVAAFGFVLLTLVSSQSIKVSKRERARVKMDGKGTIWIGDLKVGLFER